MAYLTLTLAYALAVLLTAAEARAQVVSDQERLFQQTLANPGDHETSFFYARKAMDNGDYEAAIGVLERLLFYRSDLVLVKFELGTLYFRLGSYEMAKRYFKDALESPNLDDITKRRIKNYLPDAEKQLRPSRLSIFAHSGLRSQSNASLAPMSGMLRLDGQDLALLPTARARRDTNWFGLAGLNHDYDLQNQRGDIIETRAAGYLTEHSRLTEMNTALLDVSFGPRLALSPKQWPGATIKPYIAAGMSWVGGSSYFSTAGLGLSFRIPLNDRLTVGQEVEWRRANFEKIDPLSSVNSGNLLSVSLAADFLLNPALRLNMRSSYRRGDADLTFQSFDQWIVEAAMTFEFTPPFASISRNWSFAPFARWIGTGFDRPNPLIDPLVARKDRQWTIGAVLNTPVAGNFGITTTIQYDKTLSSLPNYRLDNISVISGPTARF